MADASPLASFRHPTSLPDGSRDPFWMPPRAWRAAHLYLAGSTLRAASGFRPRRIGDRPTKIARNEGCARPADTRDTRRQRAARRAPAAKQRGRPASGDARWIRKANLSGGKAGRRRGAEAETQGIFKWAMSPLRELPDVDQPEASGERFMRQMSRAGKKTRQVAAHVLAYMRPRQRWFGSRPHRTSTDEVLTESAVLPEVRTTR